MAGSVGNHQRVNYSVFGDTVNIAARLEKLTKRLPAPIRNRVLMTDSTALLVQAHCPTIPVGQLMLEGRQTATTLQRHCRSWNDPSYPPLNDYLGEEQAVTASPAVP
ncbi:MAG: hypothetical protein HC922_01770 [Leptolyngbyaceae cyanobacterium SM2_3_12]|nr:hypothetical protein [Leptolyngbyaceae cyanobacterium SM2_3_12]